MEDVLLTPVGVLTATPVRAKAAAALMRLSVAVTVPADEGLRRQYLRFYDALIAAFRHAGDTEREQWLDALCTLVGHDDDVFVNVIDDADYDALEALRQPVADTWHRQLLALATGAEPWADAPLQERLRRLQHFYRADAGVLGGGAEAHRCTRAARRCLEQCRRQLCTSQPHDHAGTFFPMLADYYWALCLALPGRRRSGHEAYYSEVSSLCTTATPHTTDDRWLRRAVLSHYAWSSYLSPVIYH